MTPEEIHEYINDQIELRMEHIVDLAVKKVFNQMYEEIGKGFVKKVLWIVGVGAVLLLGWLAGKGFLKP